MADKAETTLMAIVIGDISLSSQDNLIRSGADKIFVVNDPDISYFNEENYRIISTEFIQEHGPTIVLAGATSVGPRWRCSSWSDAGSDCLRP